MRDIALYHGERHGWIEVITGVMFSGKSEEMIRRVLGELMATAETVDKLFAICVACGNPATRNQRLVDGRPAPAEARDAVVLTHTSLTR